ncbi:phage tail tape measure protein [Musicola paradisiaca]|uniref:Phage tail tape measure protein n=1 Tax=Musicola paradisiaca (strain Ech703) TaxID=579405 RepID=C6C6Z6_MUSP7|nr:hypothetical protein [Musicola paradisiaca]ACS85890.1 hypothetical protein Dd703_2103 [Musicola paradisiaca Ech703]
MSKLASLSGLLTQAAHISDQLYLAQTGMASANKDERSFSQRMDALASLIEGAAKQTDDLVDLANKTKDTTLAGKKVVRRYQAINRLNRMKTPVPADNASTSSSSPDQPPIKNAPQASPKTGNSSGRTKVALRYQAIKRLNEIKSLVPADNTSTPLSSPDQPPIKNAPQASPKTGNPSGRILAQAGKSGDIVKDFGNKGAELTKGLHQKYTELRTLFTPEQTLPASVNDTSTLSNASSALATTAIQPAVQPQIQQPLPSNENPSPKYDSDTSVITNSLQQVRLAFALLRAELTYLSDTIAGTLQYSKTSVDDFRTTLLAVEPAAKAANLAVAPAKTIPNIFPNNQGTDGGSNRAPDAQNKAASTVLMNSDQQNALTQHGLTAAPSTEPTNTALNMLKPALTINCLCTSAQQSAIDASGISGSQSANISAGNTLARQESSASSLSKAAQQCQASLQSCTQTAPGLLDTIDSVLSTSENIFSVIGSIGSFVSIVAGNVGNLIAIFEFLSPLFMVIGGTIISAISAISLPIIGIIALVAAGAALIYKYWQPIGAFLSGVFDGFVAAFSPLQGVFEQLRIPFDALFKLVGGLFNYFKDLISPIKMSQEQLGEFRQAGEIVGRVLGDILMAPINAIKWILDKIEITKNALLWLAGKSATKAEDKPELPLPDGERIVPNYNAITSGNNSKSYSDNSVINNNIQITVPPGYSDEQVKQHINSALNDQAQRKQDMQLGSMSAGLLD